MRKEANFSVVMRSPRMTRAAVVTERNGQAFVPRDGAGPPGRLLGTIGLSRPKQPDQRAGLVGPLSS
jgi:hypothetical protein